MMTIKRSALFAGLCCILMSACTSDNRQVTADMIHFPDANGEASADAPVITFDSATCRFGTLAVGEKFVHTFRFINTGKSPLVISLVNPSCGCTTPKDWPTEPVSPGAQGQITVEFNSTGNSGQVDKTVSLVTNCIPGVWVLRLQGTVIGADVPQQNTSPVQMEMELP
jgi:hypothetical protein